MKCFRFYDNNFMKLNIGARERPPIKIHIIGGVDVAFRVLCGNIQSSNERRGENVFKQQRQTHSTKWEIVHKA